MSKCDLCKKEITASDLDDPDKIYRQVSSWVTGPKLQNPVLRHQTGVLAHASCVRKVLDGEAPDQEAIPGLEEE